VIMTGALSMIEGYEGQRPDALARDDRLQVRRQIGILAIGDADRLGVAVAGLPGRVSGHGVAIRGRQPAPGDEAHLPVLVEQQDRGAAAGQRPDDGIERRVIDFVAGRRAEQPVGIFIERRLLGHAPRDGLLQALARGQVLQADQCTQDLPVLAADRVDRDDDVDPVAVGLLADDLEIAHRPAVSQHADDRAVQLVERRPVAQRTAPESAIALGGIGQIRAAAPKLGAALVVTEQATVLTAEIEGNRQRVQELRGRVPDLPRGGIGGGGGEILGEINHSDYVVQHTGKVCGTDHKSERGPWPGKETDPAWV
jgi:hypothetical protein